MSGPAPGLKADHFGVGYCRRHWSVDVAVSSCWRCFLPVEAQTLAWYLVDDLNDFVVCPCEVVCPCHIFAT